MYRLTPKQSQRLVDMQNRLACFFVWAELAVKYPQNVVSLCSNFDILMQFYWENTKTVHKTPHRPISKQQNHPLPPLGVPCAIGLRPEGHIQPPEPPPWFLALHKRFNLLNCQLYLIQFHTAPT